MDQMKKIPRKNFDDFIAIVINAYPGFKITSEEERRKFRQRLLKLEKEEPTISTYGLYRGSKLLGGMRLYDFSMRLLSTTTTVGGVGLVAVDLLHKKEKVCKELIGHFLQHYRKKGACLTALYPFRPDFYKKMGFGYGTKINQYRIKPANLPRGDSKKHVCYLQEKDWKMLIDCHNRYAEKTHGMMKKSKFELSRFERQNAKVVGYKSRNKVLGYIAFTFKPNREDNFLLYDLHILEFIYENRAVFLELLTFLHTQADQVHHIIHSTQDDCFHHLPLDPRNDSDNLLMPLGHETNVQGVGIMYRVINIESIFRALKNHNFGNQNCKLKLSINDSFFKGNDGSHVIHFTDGKPRLEKGDKYEVEICLDVSDFSSLIMGVISFKSLFDYGLAEISDTRYMNTINKIFATEEKPICTTLF